MEIIEARLIDGGVVLIIKSRKTGSITYCQGDFTQSEADSNGISQVSYVHALFGLLHQANSRDVLLIGCGGGTLATMLHLAGAKATIVDINEASFSLASKYFKLPPAVLCHIADGQSFLENNPGRYDAIVVDAYIGGTMPSHFMGEPFHKLTRSRLNNSGGCVLVNAFLKHDLDLGADLLANAMRNVFDRVRILDEPGMSNRNALVMGGAVAEMRAPRMIIEPENEIDEIRANLERMAFRPIRAPVIPVGTPTHQDLTNKQRG